MHAWYVLPWTARRSKELKHAEGAHSLLWNPIPQQGDFFGPALSVDGYPPELREFMREWALMQNTLVVMCRVKVADIVADMDWSSMLKRWRPGKITPEESTTLGAQPGDPQFPSVVVLVMETGTGRVGWVPACWLVRDMVRL